MSGSKRKKRILKDEKNIFVYLFWMLVNTILIAWRFKKYVVIGRENLPKSGPFLLVSNHITRWDGLVVYKLIGRPTNFMVSPNELVGLQGRVLVSMGSFPADPRAELINHSLNLFAKGQGIVVFPEGNIFQDDNTHHFKTGAAKIAIAAAEAGFDLPIIPLAINYADDGKIAQLVLGTPVSASEYAEGAIASNEAHSKQMRALTDRLYREVCHLRASLGNIADRQALLASPIRRRFAVCTANDAAVNSSMASIPREDRAVVAELDRQAG